MDKTTEQTTLDERLCENPNCNVDVRKKKVIQGPPRKICRSIECKRWQSTTNANKRNAKKRLNRTVKCGVCGKYFKPIHGGSTHCSPECYNTRRNQRKAICYTTVVRMSHKVMYEEYGIPLFRGFIIHHMDNQHWNDHIHNLELFTSTSLHYRERHI